jgi:hypothetical protein
MNMPSIRAIAIFLTLAAISCSDNPKEDNNKEDKLADIVATFGFHVDDMAQSNFDTIDKLESLDRDSYAPVSFERAWIRSDAELDGWHGPTIGNYYLAFESYTTMEESQRRESEYLDYERFARVVGSGVDRSDITNLSKTSGRCWAYSSGSRVYLLSSHAAMQSALEERTKAVLNGVKAYEKKRGEPQR